MGERTNVTNRMVARRLYEQGHRDGGALSNSDIAWAYEWLRERVGNERMCKGGHKSGTSACVISEARAEKIAATLDRLSGEG